MGCVRAHVSGVGQTAGWAPRLGRRGGKTDDLEGVGDNADGHQLLSVVATVHHEGVGKALDDGAVGLAEALDGIATGRVRQVDGRADLDVVAVEEAMLAFDRKLLELCCVL